MMTMYYILLAMGAFFILLGGVVTAVLAGAFSIAAGDFRGEFDFFLLIPMIFVVIGIVFVVISLSRMRAQKKIVEKGKRYPAKIYGYVDDTRVLVNGQYPTNLKVHFFDERGIEREAIIPTSFAKNSGGYAIGMTIDIFEYCGKFSWDKKSLRFEKLPREEELMDDKPIAPEDTHLVAVTCPGCGASFEAVAGYTNRCPYCGNYMNA
ncbi:MAG: hypothetical protein Q4B26_08625 [Eubacteriales bacterium]|nr:hypothetical protein [Eubacteriales bacterium]